MALLFSFEVKCSPPFLIAPYKETRTQSTNRSHASSAMMMLATMNGSSYGEAQWPLVQMKSSEQSSNVEQAQPI